MAGKFLLDTNIVIALFLGDKSVLSKLKEPCEIFVSCIVAGELFYGAENSSKVDENLEKIKDLLFSCTVLPCDQDTAHEYGRIKTSLKAKGSPIPENDIWIAATAIQFGLTLISRDKHFSEIEDLNLQTW